MIPGAEIKLGRQEGAEAQNWVGRESLWRRPDETSGTAARCPDEVACRPGFTEIHTDSDKGREEVQIRSDRELAKKYNMSSQSLGNTLGIVVRGQEIRGYRTPEGEVDIWMRLQASDRSDLQDLRSIVVGAGAGRQ